MVNTGAIHHELVEGDIHQDLIAQILPYDGNFFVGSFKGVEIRAMLEHSVSSEGSGGFLAVKVFSKRFY